MVLTRNRDGLSRPLIIDTQIVKGNYRWLADHASRLANNLSGNQGQEFYELFAVEGAKVASQQKLCGPWFQLYTTTDALTSVPMHQMPADFKTGYRSLQCVVNYVRKEKRCNSKDPNLGCMCGRGPCYAPNLWVEARGGSRGNQWLTVAHAMLDVSIINNNRGIFERKYLYLPVARLFSVWGPKLHFETNLDLGPKDKPLMVLIPKPDGSGWLMHQLPQTGYLRTQPGIYEFMAQHLQKMGIRMFAEVCGVLPSPDCMPAAAVAKRARLVAPAGAADAGDHNRAAAAGNAHGAEDRTPGSPTTPAASCPNTTRQARCSAISRGCQQEELPGRTHQVLPSVAAAEPAYITSQATNDAADRPAVAADEGELAVCLESMRVASATTPTAAAAAAAAATPQPPASTAAEEAGSGVDAGEAAAARLAAAAEVASSNSGFILEVTATAAAPTHKPCSLGAMPGVEAIATQLSSAVGSLADPQLAAALQDPAVAELCTELPEESRQGQRHLHEQEGLLQLLRRRHHEQPQQQQSQLREADGRRMARGPLGEAAGSSIPTSAVQPANAAELTDCWTLLSQLLQPTLAAQETKFSRQQCYNYQQAFMVQDC